MDWFKIYYNTKDKSYFVVAGNHTEKYENYNIIPNLNSKTMDKEVDMFKKEGYISLNYYKIKNTLTEIN